MPEVSQRERGSSGRRRRTRSLSPSSMSYSSDSRSDSRSYSYSPSSRSRSLSYSPSPPPRTRRRSRDAYRRRVRYEAQREPQPEVRVQGRRTRDDRDGYERYETRQRGDACDSYERTPRYDGSYERRRRDDSQERRRPHNAFERYERTPPRDSYQRGPRDDRYVRSRRNETRQPPLRDNSLERRRRGHSPEDDRRPAPRRDLDWYDRHRDDNRYDRRRHDERGERRHEDTFRSSRRPRSWSRSLSRSPPPPPRERGGSYRAAPLRDDHGPRPWPRSPPSLAREEPRIPARHPSRGMPTVNGTSGADAGAQKRAWLEEDERAAKAGESMWQRRQRMRDRAAGRVEVWGVSPDPPGKLEDRFEVGADERKKKERKRKRKEERRARREAKRARKAGVKAVEEKGADSVGAAKVGPEGTANGGIGKIRKEIRGPRLPPDDEDDDDDDGVIGPPVPTSEKDAVGKNVDYGKALRPGEGSKMAAFVQDGVRIPRRGEIGLTSDQIEAFESQGYVMSGNRNRRMEAVRIRKENQIYSAEELAALSQFSHEERKLREERVLNQFRVLVKSKLGDGAGDKPPDAA